MAKDKITYFRSILYRTGKILGDVQSIRKKRIGKRVGYRIAGKVSGRLFSKFFR
jgi:hypothetical protein|tara:strand:- start:635 stop:796 length:162 start_codon:yes stop_codon:yes gene_type:complete